MIVYAAPSELASFVNSANPPMQEALDKLPLVVEATARLAHAKAACEAYATGETAIRTGDDIENAVRAAIADGDPLPVDLHHQLATANAQTAADNQVKMMLSQLLASIGQERDTAIRRGVDKMLAHLDGDLTTTLGKLRTATTKVAGLTSAQDAIDAGAVADWQTLTAARTRYDHIRAAQRLIVGRLWPEDLTGRMVMQNAEPVALHIANPTEVFPQWATWSRFGHLVDQYGAKEQLHAPWPDVKDDPDRFTDWLINTPQAQAWVPTSDMYEQLLSELFHARADPNPGGTNPVVHRVQASHFTAPTKAGTAPANR